MKSKKMYIVLGSLALLALLIVGFGLASSEGPPFCSRSFHQRFHGRGFHQHVLKRLDSKMALLELSEDQQAAYGQIRARIETDMKAHQSEKQSFLNELKDQLNQENPDMEAIVSQLKEKLALMPDRISGHLNYIVELYNILDEQQKAKVLEHFKEKINQCTFSGQQNEE